MRDKLSPAIQSICVYCGASVGNHPIYAQSARELAAALVSSDMALVYGGGNIGLMGEIANEMLRLGGKVTGVMPRALVERELAHTGVTRLITVGNMHERKAIMAELSDAFIALPGGIGTLEELFEMLTGAQLGFHQKPVGILNINGFYNGLIHFLQHLVASGFLKAQHAALLMHEENPHTLLQRMQDYIPQQTDKLRTTLTQAPNA